MSECIITNVPIMQANSEHGLPLHVMVRGEYDQDSISIQDHGGTIKKYLEVAENSESRKKSHRFEMSEGEVMTLDSNDDIKVAVKAFICINKSLGKWWIEGLQRNEAQDFFVTPFMDYQAK